MFFKISYRLLIESFVYMQNGSLKKQQMESNICSFFGEFFYAAIKKDMAFYT